MTKRRVPFEKIKEILEKNKYIPTDDVVWNMVKGIKNMVKGNQKGQDIYSVVLEGPPGAGKTFYATTYKKVLEEFFGEEVSFVEYQCDGTTGKADLYEEIAVSQAIAGNPDNVILEGKLIEAINEVNKGKKVILFLDEFEKSRRETDSFMYGFEQSGKVITTQTGKVEVKPEYRKNLQVILCKNDERELSDPLLRRERIIRLELMTPENFQKTVNMNLSNLDEDIRNIVVLLYTKMYKHKDDFAKFPSCSEGMIAIQDACDLLEEEAPAEVIYTDILSNLLKYPDDVETFKMMFKKDKQLKSFVGKILEKNSNSQSTYSPRDEIYRNFFSKELQELTGMKELFLNKEKKYKMEIENLKAKINQDNNDIPVYNEKNINKNSTNQDSLFDEQLANFESIDWYDGKIEYMPVDIVNVNNSVFDNNPTDEWYEIMTFEVKEKGWKALKEFVKDGIDGYTKDITKLPFYMHSMIQDEKILEQLRKQWFENLLCTDGIILNEDKMRGYKIIAIKEKENGKNYYKIFSNKSIQQANIAFEGSCQRLMNPELRPPYIGLDGFREILEEKGVLISCIKNFLCYSDGIEENRNNFDEIKKEKCRRILPGLFNIQETVEADENGRIGSVDLRKFGSRNWYSSEAREVEYIKMYEKILKNNGKINIIELMKNDEGSER